jgi:hypothetical protein
MEAINSNVISQIQTKKLPGITFNPNTTGKVNNQKFVNDIAAFMPNPAGMTEKFDNIMNNIASFKDMARKGFYSFDREIAPTIEEDTRRQFQLRYVLIACPRQLRANKLPNIENVPEIEYNAKLFEDCLVNRKELSISLNAVNKMWRLTCIERRLLRKKGNDNPSFL